MDDNADHRVEIMFMDDDSQKPSRPENDARYMDNDERVKKVRAAIVDSGWEVTAAFENLLWDYIQLRRAVQELAAADREGEVDEFLRHEWG